MILKVFYYTIVLNEYSLKCSTAHNYLMFTSDEDESMTGLNEIITAYYISYKTSDLISIFLLVFFEIFIMNYCVGVMNDIIFKIKFPKFTFYNFISLRLVKYLILRILVIHVIRTYSKTP